jgi:ActR/RegA family two-component response regulator
MNKFLIAAAIAATLGLPAIAAAQAAPTDSTIVCRPVASGETANGTIQNTAYLCRPLNMDKIRSAMNSAMTDLTPAQKAKMDFAMQVLRDELQLQPKYPGFNGNQNN